MTLSVAAPKLSERTVCERDDRADHEDGNDGAAVPDWPWPVCEVVDQRVDGERAEDTDDGPEGAGHSPAQFRHAATMTQREFKHRCHHMPGGGRSPVSHPQPGTG